ncbi:IPT/TIG domain-containing protein [Streptomyces ferrugineus]|uniref:IPT/TIG domain-containing protein n=1 Tax=Streptomyces ferrugineus TaxID=1413221 RepID=A0A7M2SV57_9ACTN|nr:IPT/TIG domain-containing protein [Streptomyces ferrugineus]QOV40152.1 IPT/TIG domain-containing protein [Streptomyces ferrugineus]
MAGETTNNNEILIPQLSRLWLAPVGTAAPADATVAMPAGWYTVGLFTEDSLKFNSEPNFEQVRSAQSSYPTRTFQTTDAATVEVDLQQWSGKNFRAVYGGGRITAVTPSGGGPKHFKFAPPRIGGRTEIAGCIEIIDGGKHYRYVIPRTMQMEGVSKDLAKTKESVLPLRLAVQGGDDTDPWYVLTDDPAFQPPVPTIATVTPSTGPVAGGTAVMIVGTDLDTATAVTFGGTAGTDLTVESDTKLTVTTPASTSGAKDVIVTTAGGSVTKTGGFTYA